MAIFLDKRFVCYCNMGINVMWMVFGAALIFGIIGHALTAEAGKTVSNITSFLLAIIGAFLALNTPQ